jgi:hypothetical protein
MGLAKRGCCPSAYQVARYLGCRISILEIRDLIYGLMLSLNSILRVYMLCYRSFKSLPIQGVRACNIS